MNKEEYLKALEQELMILPLEERLSALQYYKDYFDDAGKENEAKVIAELGSPKKVASDILKDYRELSADVKLRQNPEERTQKTHSDRINHSLLLILLAIFIIPIGFPLIFAVLGVIVGLIAVVFALLLCVLILSIAFIIAGVALTAKGFIALFISPLNALLTAGVGLFLFGLGLILGIFFVKLCTASIPPMLRWFVDLCRRPFNCRRGIRT